jgi:AcrR family transcriptional regulator
MAVRNEKKAADRERQRDEILGVALRSFARSGYAGASMNEIAAEAGYSVGHVYNVIGNKEAVFEAVMMREGAVFEDAIDDAISRHQEGEASELINELVDVSLSFFDSHRDYFQIYLNESGGMRANVARVFTGPMLELDRRLMAKVKKVLARAVREGSAAPLPAGDLHIAVTELVNGFICAWAVDGYKGRISRKAAIIKQLIWKGIQA